MPSSSVTPTQDDLDLSTLNRDSVLNGVDDVIKTLYANGNINFAVSVLNAFEEFSNISGFARAKLLWGAQKWFVETGQSGDFYEKFGIKDKGEQTYTDRLIRLWDAIQSQAIPEKVMKGRKVRELLPISEALSQGFQISDKVWKELAAAIDMGEISTIIQKSKGKQPKKGTLTLVADSRGFITAWVDGHPHHAGTLNYADMDTDPVVKKAVLSIKNGNRKIRDEK